jgi:ABC-type transport system involved in cytochrome c biogenesis permease subunit
MYAYFLAFLIAIFGWLTRWQPLNWTAFTLIVLTLVLHTIALVARIYISGRPPVTNLYSSAVFIGWSAVVAGVAFEAIFRIGLGNIVASVAGYATLLIAGYLAMGGDTIAVLQAVLDTQFWLATHVVCITKGYAATYMAGLCGVLYVIGGMCTPLLDRDMRKALGQAIYGILCYALLFSFFGTVLGGLWADDSWGRFWGWDPKENGALIIVLWNALVLHARWDKMIADRGLAILAIGGNIVTSWSWFGVNELGIGLHSYGFTEGVLLALMVFVGSQLLLMIGGLVPTRLWWSYNAERRDVAGA